MRGRRVEHVVNQIAQGKASYDRKPVHSEATRLVDGTGQQNRNGSSRGIEGDEPPARLVMRVAPGVDFRNPVQAFERDLARTLVHAIRIDDVDMRVVDA